MSESGSTQLPSGPVKGMADLPAGKGPISARIEKLPPPLMALSKPQTVTGDIIRRDQDNGLIRIRSDQGDIIELRARPAQTAKMPPEGTRVQIDLPAGKPPRQAALRPLPDQAPVRKEETQPPLPKAERSETPPPQSPPEQNKNREAAPAQPASQLPPAVATPLPAETPETSSPARPVIAGPAPLLPSDGLVRLLPLAPADQENILRYSSSPAPLIKTIMDRIIIRAAVMTEAAPLRADFAVPLATAALPPPASALSSPQPPLPQSTAPPATLILKAPDAAASFTIITPEQMNMLALEAIGSMATAPQPAHILTPTGPTPAFSKPQILDVQISAIIPPAPVLITPPAENVQAARAPLPFTTPDNILFLTSENKATDRPARVIGHTQQNQPVITYSPPGQAHPALFTMQIQPAVPLPADSQIILSPPPALSSTLPSVDSVQHAAPLPTAVPLNWNFMPGTAWPAADEMIRFLQHNAPPLLQNLAQTTPNPALPQSLPAAALLFIAAVRAGDLGGWLNERTIDALRRAGRSDIVDNLSRGMGANARLAAEPAAQDWRALNLPLYWQEELHKIMLYYRRDEPDQDGNSKDGKKRGTRFIFDLELPRMGPVQLDGLHRNKGDSNEGRLDLILRTVSAVSPAMQQTMRRHYLSALQTTGLHGELSFQGQARQFVKIEIPYPRTGVSV